MPDERERVQILHFPYVSRFTAR